MLTNMLTNWVHGLPGLAFLYSAIEVVILVCSITAFSLSSMQTYSEPEPSRTGSTGADAAWASSYREQPPDHSLTAQEPYVSWYQYGLISIFSSPFEPLTHEWRCIVDCDGRYTPGLPSSQTVDSMPRSVKSFSIT